VIHPLISLTGRKEMLGNVVRCLPFNKVFPLDGV
jgi:hypothetical protein